VESRLSVIYCDEPTPSQRIAPLPQVMRDEEQSVYLYREFTWTKYKRAMYKTRLADHRLGPFELRAANGNRPARGGQRRSATLQRLGVWHYGTE
jgi:gibberellin 2-oxidase